MYESDRHLRHVVASTQLEQFGAQAKMSNHLALFTPHIDLNADHNRRRKSGSYNTVQDAWNDFISWNRCPQDNFIGDCNQDKQLPQYIACATIFNQLTTGTHR